MSNDFVFTVLMTNGYYIMRQEEKHH